MQQQFQLNAIMTGEYMNTAVMILFYFVIVINNHLKSCHGLCFILRKYSVDSFSLQPTWVPLVSMTTAENRLYFTLKLMTGTLVVFFFRHFLFNGFFFNCFWRNLLSLQTTGSLRERRPFIFWVTPLTSKSLPLLTTTPLYVSSLTVAQLRLLLIRKTTQNMTLLNMGNDRNKFSKWFSQCWRIYHQLSPPLTVVSLMPTWQTPTPTLSPESSSTSWGSRWMHSSFTSSLHVRLGLYFIYFLYNLYYSLGISLRTQIDHISL